jgi:ribonucleotide reductase alpha subunit
MTSVYFETSLYEEKYIKNIIKIQSIFRGKKTRKMLKKSTDNFNISTIKKCLDLFIQNHNFYEDLNSTLNGYKKCRHENLPSHISENLAKIGIYKFYKKIWLPTWNIKPGDLCLVFDNKIYKRIEVKGFTSDGPSSFGPKEEWDWIYFVDLKNFKQKHVKIYEIKLSNKSERWRNLKFGRSTYGEIADANKRGNLRCAFNLIKKQLGNDCRCIVDCII